MIMIIQPKKAICTRTKPLPSKSPLTRSGNYVHMETPLSPWEYLQQPQLLGTIYINPSACMCVCVCVCVCVCMCMCVCECG